MNRFKYDTAIFDKVHIIETMPMNDERGYFERMFCENEFLELGLTDKIVQINHTYTRSIGTVRGMHYQLPPFAETKIIKCINGSIYDVIIDIRQNSPTFLEWRSIELSRDNGKMILIPQGFAHGFQTLENDVELMYFHTNFYNRDYERGINILDNKISINLPLTISNISKKDKELNFIDVNFKGVLI